MVLKKSQLYSSLWKSCDELRGGMDASQYKDYILTLLFVKYVSDKQKADPDSLIDVPQGGFFDNMLALKGKTNIGEGIDKIIGKLAEANDLVNVIDLASFNAAGLTEVDRPGSTGPLNLLPLFRDPAPLFPRYRAAWCGYEAGDFPASEELHGSSFKLPRGSTSRDEDVVRLYGETIKRVVAGL